MRRFTRKDANHAANIQAFRECGFSVLDLSQLGGGIPDAFVQRNRMCALVEFKAPRENGRLSAGAARSLESQKEWALNWKGPVYICESPSDVPRVIHEMMRYVCENPPSKVKAS